MEAMNATNNRGDQVMNTTLTTALNELALGSAKAAELPLEDFPADVRSPY